MKNDISGNQALVVTPMAEDGSVDEPSLRRMLDYVVEGGTHGVLILGSTGEFFSLSRAEREHVITVAADQIGGRCALGVGTGDTGSQLASDLARFAADKGADYVMVPPPYYAPLSMNTDRGIHAFFSEFARETPIPIMLYDGGSGIEISIDVIQRLREDSPNITAIKINVVKPAKVRAVLDAGITPFCGMDALTMPMMRYGAQGFTLGVGNLLPRQTTDFFEHCNADEWDKAADLFYGSLLPVINATLAFLPEYVASFKVILHAMGVIDSPVVRPPLVPLDDVRKVELNAAAKRVGLVP